MCIRDSINAEYGDRAIQHMMRLTIQSLSCLLLLPAVASLSCASMSGANAWALSDARECLQSLPINSTSAADTVEKIQRYLTMYSFVDILRNYDAEPRFASHADLPSLVAAIPTTTGSEIDFHMALMMAIRQNKDEHTQYDLPTTFSDFRYSIPLTTSVYQSGSELVMTVTAGPGFDSTYETITGQTASTYASGNTLRVDRINGTDWKVFIQQWADTYLSNSRDPNTR
eukprot:TRINITY_DN435_c0_g1_i3.p1 TRINITY_DN435_c0_g1~~TRINITY_DN435_c0_g1_i3.p1  ORF type:complete len:228 (+),score=40.26 TRINITY_DN435_c0_g1_i3:137-820(+)